MTGERYIHANKTIVYISAMSGKKTEYEESNIK